MDAGRAAHRRVVCGGDAVTVVDRRAPSQTASTVVGELEAFYNGSDAYHQHLREHDQSYFASYCQLVQSAVTTGDVILDVGCGTGASSQALGDAGYRCVGVDLALRYLLDAVGRRARDVSFATGRAAELPFRDGVFAAVGMCQVIEHLPDVEAALAETVRVLQPGGALIILSPNLLSPFPPLRDLARLLVGRPGRPGWGERPGQAWSLLWQNLALSWRKARSRGWAFTFRQPCLDGRVIGWDADAVFLANPFDLVGWLRHRGFGIVRVAIGASAAGRWAARLTPYLAGEMAIIARKPHKAFVADWHR